MDIGQDKKLMFVIPSLEGGGAERVAAHLLNEFCKMEDINIVLVLFSRKHGYGLPRGISVRYVDVAQYKNNLYAIIKFLLIVFKLSKVIREEKPFNVLSFMAYTNLAVILSKTLFSKKTHVTIGVHTPPSLHLVKYASSFIDKIMLALIKIFYNRADKIIVISEFIKNDLTKFKIDSKKIVRIYNPIDIKSVSDFSEEAVMHPWFKENIPVFLSIGRLSKEKGFDYLLKALAIVREKTDARLLILGEGEEKIHLKELSNKLGVDDAVDFIGFQQNPYKFMKRANIYVMSSLYEGFPMVLLEAMVCGLPVVSTIYNPGANEIIENEKNGLLAPPADEKALADAMLRLLTNPEERMRYSARAKQEVVQFSIEKITEQYKRILLDI